MLPASAGPTCTRLVDKTGQHDLSQLRTLQDWYVRYWLEAVPGVSEVASVGGFVKQYQVDINPDTLLAYHLPINQVIDAIRHSNNDVGGRVVEYTGREYMVRGLGYIKSVADLQKVVVGTNGNGTPIYLGDVADVHLGPDIRRGMADLNGEGQVAGGIVVARYGENALARHQPRKGEDRPDQECAPQRRGALCRSTIAPT